MCFTDSCAPHRALLPVSTFRVQAQAPSKAPFPAASNPARTIEGEYIDAGSTAHGFVRDAERRHNHIRCTGGQVQGPVRAPWPGTSTRQGLSQARTLTQSVRFTATRSLSTVLSRRSMFPVRAQVPAKARIHFGTTPSVRSLDGTLIREMCFMVSCEVRRPTWLSDSTALGRSSSR